MPYNNNWVHTSMWYKPQDYKYSCFSSCLQVVLANWGIIKPEGRVIEDEFNNFFNQALDNKAPGIEEISRFLNERKEKIVSDFSNARIDVDFYETIKQRVNNSKQCAIIGAINGTGGHALCLMRNEDKYYGFNPSFDSEEIQLYGTNPLKLAEGSGEFAINIPEIGCVNLFYFITPK